MAGFGRWAALLMLVTGSAPAAAAAPAAEFRSGGLEFQVPMPEGYCLPAGSDVDIAQLVAAGDSANVTHLTLVPCSKKQGLADDYIILKTPKAVLLVTFDRPQFLEELGAAFGSPELSSALASGKLLEQSGKEMGEVIGVPVDLTGEIKPLGKDDVCAYLGGTINVSSAAASYRIAVGMCMTVVAGRVLTINWYGPDRGSAGVASLLLKSKRLAGQITGKPAS